MPAAQGYIGRNPADSSTVIARQSFSPTGIQTDFTFAAGYSVGYVDLYLNGARLIEGQDFTATDGSTVGLTTNAVNGDVLEVVAFKAFNATNVTASGGNFTVGQNLTVSGTAEVTGAITATGGVVGDATGLSGTPDITVRHLKATGISTVSDTTQSTTTTSGALIVSGGLGVAKNLFVGGSMNVAGTLTYEDVTNSETPGITTTGGLVVTGLGATFGSGVGIADSIYHIDDSNTAIRFPGADTFTVETAGSERLRVQSDGDVGIGTDDPGAYQLHVHSEDYRALQLVTNNDGANGPEIRLRHNSTSPADDDTIGQIVFTTNDSGGNQSTVVRIDGIVTDVTDGTEDGALTFSTRSNGSFGERVRVTSAGKVGMGTDDPDFRFHSNETAGSSIAGLFETNQTDAFISFQASGTTASSTVRIGAVGNDFQAFVNGAERLRITSGGNVDINGTPPWTVTGGSYRNLSISGEDASSSGFLWLGNGAAATNADFDLGRVNFVNGANIVAQIKGSTQTSANDDGRIAFFTKATGSSISEKVRITANGKVAIGTISDYSSAVTDAPVYIAMQSDITGIGDHEGGATAGMVRIEETGSNDGRFHGIELRNKNAGDIRILNSDQSTSDRGDLLLIMPDEDASDGTHLKMRVNSLKSSIQISGKGGAVAGNAQENHTDIYIATKTGMTAVNTGLGAEVAGLIRFEDKGTNNNRYHGIEIRNRNSGDARILNLDEGTTNKANLVFAIDNGSTVVESLRLNSAGNAVFAGTVEDSIGPLRRLGIQGASSSFTLAADHAGKLVRMNSSAQTITLPQNIFTAGDMISIFNVSTGDTTIAQGTGATLYNSSDGSTGNRTLGAKGICTIVCSASNEFVISGSNLS